MRNVSDLIHVFNDTEIAGYFDCNYLFCIVQVVVEKNAAPTATYSLRIRFLSMRGFHDSSVFVNSFGRLVFKTKIFRQLLNATDNYNSSLLYL